MEKLGQQKKEKVENKFRDEKQRLARRQTTFPPSSQHEVLVRQMRKRMHRRGILQRRGLSPLAVTHLYHQPTHTKYTTRETVPFGLSAFYHFLLIENNKFLSLNSTWRKLDKLFRFNCFPFFPKKWKFTFLVKND